jgi:protein-tyrosine phosphatase
MTSDGPVRGQTLGSHAGPRVIRLDGARNFRDLGGYTGLDGRPVRHGLLYRSGSLGGLTSVGRQSLRSLGICSLCDLRTSQERASAPVDWYSALGLRYWSRDYETSFGELRRLMTSDLPDVESARAAMIEGYRRLPFEQAPAYRELFRQLHEGSLPLVFNCSAGKDRAGTAAAIILLALGVSREQIMADFAATDVVGGLEGLVLQSRAQGGVLGRQPEAVIRAILSADPAYLGAALDRIAPDPECFRGYLEAQLGVDSARLATVRDRLLARQGDFG